MVACDARVPAFVRSPTTVAGCARASVPVLPGDGGLQRTRAGTAGGPGVVSVRWPRAARPARGGHKERQQSQKYQPMKAQVLLNLCGCTTSKPKALGELKFC